MSGPSERVRVRRRAERGRYGAEEIRTVLDAGLVCHVAVVLSDGTPVALPTAYVRLGERLLLHGSPSNALLRRLAGGAPACATVTLLDGLVLARSAAHHSLNYRSVVAFGHGAEVSDLAQKREALRALTERVVPGRWEGCRPPDDDELRGTLVVALAIEEASAKVRDGPPVDLEPDRALPFWAGVVPLAASYGAPVPAPDQRPGLSLPEAVRRLQGVRTAFR